MHGRWHISLPHLAHVTCTQTNQPPPPPPHFESSVSAPALADNFILHAHIDLDRHPVVVFVKLNLLIYPPFCNQLASEDGECRMLVSYDQAVLVPQLEYYCTQILKDSALARKSWKETSLALCMLDQTSLI